VKAQRVHSKPVTVVGYASLDTTTTVVTFRGVNATSILQRPLTTLEPGIGGIAYIVGACAAIGASVQVISWVGPDADGVRWSQGVAQAGVGVLGVSVHGTRSPRATVIDIQTGGTICLFEPGDCHPPTITRGQGQILEAGAWVVLTVSPRQITEDVLDRLPKSAKLIWAVKHDDDAYSENIVIRILERADVVSFSDGERSYLTIDGIDPERRVRAGTLVVETKGAEGLAWSIGSPNGGVRPGFIAVERVNTQDSTGAGDTFIGTLAGLLARLPELSSLSDQDISSSIARASSSAGDLLRRRNPSCAVGAESKE